MQPDQAPAAAAEQPTDDSAAAAVAAAAVVAARIDALYSDLPDGYQVDKEGRGHDDSWTYGELGTPDLARLLCQVPDRSASEFVDLGSGTGKLVLLAAAMGFGAAAGAEISAPRHGVAVTALGRLPPEEAARVRLSCGTLLALPLGGARVVLAHNIVYKSGLQRAMQLKLDRELPEGAVVLAVAELRFSKRAALLAEHAVRYNWAADDGGRALFEYVMRGAPLPPGSDSDADD